MNKHLRTSLTILATLILALALTSGALAKPQQDFFLTYSLGTIAWDQYYAEGEFIATEPIPDQGQVSVRWTSGDFSHFTLVFEGGKGSFTARMTLSEQTEYSCWLGVITLDPSAGTGAYAGARGMGDTRLCGEINAPRLFGSIQGWMIK